MRARRAALLRFRRRRLLSSLLELRYSTGPVLAAAGRSDAIPTLACAGPFG